MRAHVRAVIASLMLLGCASSQAKDQPTTAEPPPDAHAGGPPPMGAHGGMGHGPMHGHAAQPGHGAAHADSCPLHVEGTTVRAEDIEGGAALVFTTSGDVAEVRRRVAHLAEMHAQHHGAGGHGGKGMHGGGMHSAPMVPADVRSQDVDAGARLVFTPRDPAQLGALREHIRKHAQHATAGECPMMAHTSGQAAPGTAPQPAPESPAKP